MARAYLGPLLVALLPKSLARLHHLFELLALQAVADSGIPAFLFFVRTVRRACPDDLTNDHCAQDQTGDKPYALFLFGFSPVAGLGGWALLSFARRPSHWVPVQ